MSITPPYVFFRKLPDTWVATSTGPSVLNLVKPRSTQPMDTTINSISYPMSPDTSPEELADNVYSAFTARHLTTFIPTLNNGDLRKIGGIDFCSFGGIFEAPGVGMIVQNIYFNAQYSKESLNVIEIVTLLLMETALEDEPEIDTLLNNAIIAKMRR